MNEERSYQKIKDFINRLKWRMVKTMLAYYAWKQFKELQNINSCGEQEAKKNVDEINKYKNFLMTSETSNATYFVINLFKFFDTQKKALTIKKLENCASQERGNISVDDFIDDNTDRKFLTELSENYRGLGIEEINKITSLREKNTGIIKEISDARHLLVHDFISEQDSIKLPSFERLEALLNDVMEMIDIASSNLMNEFTVYTHFEDLVKNELNKLILR